MVPQVEHTKVASPSTCLLMRNCALRENTVDVTIDAIWPGSMWKVELAMQPTALSSSKVISSSVSMPTPIDAHLAPSRVRLSDGAKPGALPEAQ